MNLLQNILDKEIKIKSSDKHVFFNAGFDGYYENLFIKSDIFKSVSVVPNMAFGELINESEIKPLSRKNIWARPYIIISNDISLNENADIFIEHRFPHVFKKEDLYIVKNKLKTKRVVFPSQEIKDAWNIGGAVIEYSYDNTFIPAPKKKKVIIYGLWDSSEYRNIVSIIGTLSNKYECVIIGENKGLNHKVCDYEEFKQELSDAMFFMPQNNKIHIPRRILEAMSAGCIPVYEDCYTCKGVLNSNNSILYKTVQDFTKELNNIKDEQIEIKQSALKMDDKFSLENFKTKWRDYLNEQS